jgi:hypothetical protein
MEREHVGNTGLTKHSDKSTTSSFFSGVQRDMRAPPANNNELFAVLGFAAFLAAAILYWQTPKTKQQPNSVVIVQKQPDVAVRPAQWNLGGAGPGWASGRWLGEGDFAHHGRMDHPYSHQPSFSGHPMGMQPLPTAPTKTPLMDPRLGPR